jgi:dTDP-4-amino-4,6-dideoxygalactose transaminase
VKTPHKVPFVDLGAQYRAIQGEIDAAIAEVLRNTDFILGDAVEAFEGEFAQYCEAGHAIGVDSGLAALELALRAYGIGPGDEVITTANTFVGTALAISHSGAKPVLVDVDADTYNMDVAALRRAITPRTRAVIPVHLYGHPADMDSIMGVARQYGLTVIEDACQAHGARYKGNRVGSLGHAAAFSFYPGKNLGAYGDGGMVVTNDAAIAEKLKMLRNYGQREKYQHLLRGFNHRLDTLQAAVLRVKLKYLDSWNSARRQNAQHYCELLASSGMVMPVVAGYAEPVWHLFVVRLRDRDRAAADLATQGIVTGIHYPAPIHLQPAYRDLGYKQGDFPVSESYARQILSLPMYPELTAAQIEAVARAIRTPEGESQAQIAA